MADERVVAQLVAENANRFIKDFEASAQAVAGLQTRLESADRIRTSQLQGNIEKIRETIQQLSTDGVQGVNELSAAFEKLATRLESVARIRTSQLTGDIQNIQKALAGGISATLRGEAGVARNIAQIGATRVGTLDPTLRLQQQQLQAVAAAQRAAQVAAEAHARTLQGRLQVALQSVGNIYTQVTQRIHGTTQAQQQNTAALINQSSATGNAQRQGITYLSTLSAIHAASFLASNRTFTLVGSFFTLGAAFSRLGPLAVTVGVAFGGLLLAINAINNGIQLLQQVFIGIITTLTRVAAVVTAATAAAGAAGVKLAADVETQLGLIKAIEDPTIEALQNVEKVVSQLALRFGVSAKDVAEAASLYVRAGGDVKEGFEEALEAIVQLQLASAGELQAAQAARTVAVGLRAFAKEGATAADVANAITRSAQASALSFTEINQAFQQAVPGAVTLGIKLDELASVIAVLGNNALRGTVAGTSFKQFLLDLINPSSKAQEILAELGVGIADSAGAIRPFVDILDDLSRALDDSAVASGRITEAQRAQAIAAIFGSRAALSSNILIRESTKALREFREETEATTAANVTDVLLLPLNKQLEILKVSVEEVGRAFGSPLLQPIRESAAAAITFVQSLIPLATLAGQAVSVVLTDQGFGALKAEIDRIVSDTKLATFFLELVNVFRNVRDVIVNQIIPAVQDVISGFAELAGEPGKFRSLTIELNNINRGIQFVGAGAALLIRNIGTLVQEFIKFEGVGGRVRQVVEQLAVVAIGSLVNSFLALAPALATAIAVLPIFSRAIILAAQVGIRLVGVYKEVELKLIDISALGAKAAIGLRIPDAVVSEDVEALDKIRRSLELVEEVTASMRETTARTFDFTAVQQEIDSFSKNVDSLTANFTDFTNRAQQSGTEFVRSFENTLGELPDILSNIRAAADRELAGIADDRERTTGFIAPDVDEKSQKEIERAIERIKEAGRDIARTLDNLAEDSSTRVGNIVERALERIGDIGDKLNRDLAKLTRDTADRIQDLNDAVTQRRGDRARQERERDQQDALLKLVQLSLDLQERAQERSLEDTRRLRQRQVEEVQRDYDLQAEAAERSFSKQQEAAERAFRNQQRAQEKALDVQQTTEEKLLQDRLDREKRDRENRRRLAEAKTPEEQQRVFQDITRQRTDLKFEARQQEQIDALRKRHEEQREASRVQQEQASISFREGQEQVALRERLKRENATIEFRARLESQAQTIRRREEDETFNRRLENEIKLDQIRSILRERTRALEDRLEDESTQRRLRQIERDERDRRNDLITEAERQRGEIFEQVNQQLAEQEQTVDKAIRNALQRLDDIEDSLTPDIRAVVAGVLAEIRGATAERAENLVKQFQLETQQARAVVGAQLAVTTPAAALAKGVEITARVLLPNNYSNLVAQGVLFALQTYGAAQETEPPIINIDIPPNDIFGQLNTRR